jgi:hypothetical protein
MTIAEGKSALKTASKEQANPDRSNARKNPHDRNPIDSNPPTRDCVYQAPGKPPQFIPNNLRFKTRSRLR